MCRHHSAAADGAGGCSRTRNRPPTFSRMPLEQSHASAPVRNQGLDEHRALVEAIKQHDLDAARTVMSAHLDRTARRVTQES